MFRVAVFLKLHFFSFKQRDAEKEIAELFNLPLYPAIYKDLKYATVSTDSLSETDSINIRLCRLFEQLLVDS